MTCVFSVTAVSYRIQRCISHLCQNNEDCKLLRFRILAGSDWALILWLVSRAIDGMPGATLSLRHEFLKSELTVVSGV